MRRGFLGVMLLGVFVLGCKKRPLKHLDDPCTSDWQCSGELRCMSDRCVKPEVFERELIRQSGVKTPAETEPVIATTGSRVRIRTARGETPVFAMCERDERLVGGGCSGSAHCGDRGCGYLTSFPSSPDTLDTLGGRWNCHHAPGEVTAHALCQRAR